MFDTRIFLDIGSNHNKDYKRMKDIIDSIHNFKLRSSQGNFIKGVKVQIFQPDKLWAESAFSPNIKDIESASLPIEWLSDILYMCYDNGLKFGISIFDDVSFDLVASKLSSISREFVGGKFKDFLYFKISSFDILRIGGGSLVGKICDLANWYDASVHISTGGASYGDLRNLTSFLQTKNIQHYVLYYCVSKYPALPQSVNLGTLMMLYDQAQKFGNNRMKELFEKGVGHRFIGYSDHTRNKAVVALAMMMAGNIELHYDLDDMSGLESKHGHCWGVSELEDLLRIFTQNDSKIRNGIFLKDFHKMMPGVVFPNSVPDLRADPEDGLRPLKIFR